MKPCLFTVPGLWTLTSVMVMTAILVPGGVAEDIQINSTATPPILFSKIIMVSVVHKIEMTPSFFNHLVFYNLCNQSCSGRCNSRERLKYSGCYCDEICERMGDCCITYEQYCKPNSLIVTSSNWTQVVRKRRVLPKSCFNVTLKNSFGQFRIVDGCIQNTTDSGNSIERCTKEPENFEEITQVVYRGVIYKNYFCVKCNHPRVTVQEMDIIDLEVNCAEQSKHAKSIFNAGGLSAFYRFAVTNCSLVQHWRLGDTQNEVEEAKKRFYCGRLMNYAQLECDRRSDTENGEYFEDMCYKYRGEYGHLYGFTRYLNPHCAKCSQEVQFDEPNKFKFCTKGKYHTYNGNVKPSNLPNFAVFLDFKSAKRNSFLKIYNARACVDHDIVNDRCITSPCPRGLLRLGDNVCAAYDAAPVRQLLWWSRSSEHAGSAHNAAASSSAGYTVVGVFSNAGRLPAGFSPSVNVHGLRQLNVYPPVMDKDTVLYPLHAGRVNCSTLRDGVLTSALQRLFAGEGARGELVGDLACFLYNTTREVYHNYLRESLTFYQSRQINMNEHRVQYLFLNHEIGEIKMDQKCQIGKMKKDFVIYDDHDIKILGYDLTGKTYTDKFLINSTLLKYDISTTPLVSSFETFANFSSRSRKLSMVCIPEILACDTATFRKHQFRFIEKDLVTFTEYRTDNCLRIDGDSVIFTSSSSSSSSSPSSFNSSSTQSVVVVCKQLLLSLPVCRPSDYFAKVWLSLVCVGVSLACLAATLVTYCAHASLRSDAGLNVISLASALVAAQSVFVGNTLFTGHQVACPLAGVVQHYSWLAAFCWMNVMAFDIWKVFSTNAGSVRSNRKDSKKFVIYSAYAWGAPFLFVFTFYVIDLTLPGINYYGGIDSCFIKGRAIIYIFAIPLFLILVANFVFFLMTIISLRKTLKIAREVRNDDKSELMIYIRMASLMGFTWLFGFLANIPKMEWLFYPFIVCNSLQGVAIFISFSLNSRSRDLWRKLFRNGMKRYHSSMSTSATSSSSTKDYSLTVKQRVMRRFGGPAGGGRGRGNGSNSPATKSTSTGGVNTMSKRKMLSDASHSIDDAMDSI